jgi:hypothetical protein
MDRAGGLLPWRRAIRENDAPARDLSRKRRAVSLPHEHGAYLTLAGATIAGVSVAAARGPALAVGLSMTAAFFARAPLEQLWRGRPARNDQAALAALGGLVVVASVMAGGWQAAVAVAMAVAMLVLSVWSRQGRVQRTTWFEAIGMASLAGAAGVIALAGSASPQLALAAAVVLAAHAGTSVPMVRAEARPRERARARVNAIVTLGVLALAVVALAGIGEAVMARALLPRAVHAVWWVAWPPARFRPAASGVRETAALVLVVLLLVV